MSCLDKHRLPGDGQGRTRYIPHQWSAVPEVGHGVEKGLPHDTHGKRAGNNMKYWVGLWFC